MWQVEIITLSYSLNLFFQMWCSQYIFQHCNAKAWGFLLLSLEEKLSIWFALQVHLALGTELFCFFLLCQSFIIQIDSWLSVLHILLCLRLVHQGLPLTSRRALSLTVVTSELVHNALKTYSSLLFVRHTHRKHGVFFHNFHFIHSNFLRASLTVAFRGYAISH